MNTIELDPSQTAAVELMKRPRPRISVMTGGPGTGKTTTLSTLLDDLDEKGVPYALAAPTGKAARRMAESTGRPASTIHRLLRWKPQGFEVNEWAPLSDWFNVVVIDEASMVDIELFSALLEGLGSARLILVGDADQLPSVGPGQVLADLVGAEEIPTARLTTLHRSAQESWVCRNAPRIIAGDVPELGSFHDFRFVDAEDVDAIRAAVVDAMKADPTAQVLTPQNTTAAGTKALNALLQSELNPKVQGAPVAVLRSDDGPVELRVRDRVMQTSNNYTLEVFNGEVGQVVDVATGGDVFVDYGDRVVTYSGDSRWQLRHAYAMTIHKSQGSEWPHVIVVCHSTHTHMLTRNLLYTAVTRSKKRTTIVGNPKGVRAAVNAPDTGRNSTLIERLRARKEGTA